MNESRELHKLPRGERCPTCGSRRWYLENGLKYCANGDQIQGFIQFDLGDEIDAGQMGQVTRKEKEVRHREKRHLTGHAGKALYLEALQLILRNQLLFLIRDKGHPEELETVVRDLWDLRTRGFDASQPEGGKGAGGHDTDGDGELEFFSSQQSTGDEGDSNRDDDMGAAAGMLKVKTRAQSWDPERRGSWPMPRMIDTLALCYLGSLLLRTSTRLGQLIVWAQNWNMPYRRSYVDLPQEMKDRMPSSYSRVLKRPLRHAPAGEDVYDAVLELALSFHLNYKLTFPPVNALATSTQLARQLGLPVHVVPLTTRLITLQGRSLGFPLSKTKRFPIDHPELLVAAALCVATKLAVPFGRTSPLLALDANLGLANFRWEQWYDRIVVPTHEQKEAKRVPDYDGFTAEDVAELSTKDLEAYFSHVASLADDTDDVPLSQFFPAEVKTQTGVPAPELTDAEVDARLVEILSEALEADEEENNPKQSAHQDEPSPLYKSYRTLEMMPKHMRGFVEVLGDAAGLQSEPLLRGVYALEQAMITVNKVTGRYASP